MQKKQNVVFSHWFFFAKNDWQYNTKKVQVKTKKFSKKINYVATKGIRPS